MTRRVVIGAVDEHGCQVEFTIVDGDDGCERISGWLKWDGCINWQTADRHLMHFCGPDEATELARLFGEVWSLGSAALGDKYDHLAPRGLDD